jgi:hypothetical protein
MVRYGAAPTVEPPVSPPQVDPWRRPADWLPMPPLLPSEQKFIGLAAVFPSNNEICLAAAGNFLVSWGDGHSQLVLSPSHPTERFQSSISTWQTVEEFQLGLAIDNRAWTHRDESSLQLRWSGSQPIAADRYRLEERNGMVVLVFEPGLNNNGGWWWLEVQWNYTGADLTPTRVRHRYSYDSPALVGSESVRGYRQALVTVTPQQGEQLTALSLQSESWSNSTLGSWLDVAIASPLLSALQIGES